jgi:hypothetical protein
VTSCNGIENGGTGRVVDATQTREVYIAATIGSNELSRDGIYRKNKE